MWLNVARYLLPFLLVLPISGSGLITNETTQVTRGQRSHRRVVRLYSGTRPKPIKCTGEGFQADPDDCTIFHRCMKNGNGKYVSFRFQCGPGTIYDLETETCNHPERTKRTNCAGKKPIYIPNIEFSLDNDINKEIPSPISTKYPINSQKTTLSFSSLQPHQWAVSASATNNPWTLTSHQYSQSTVSPISWISSTKRQDAKTTKTAPTKRHVSELFSDSIATSWMSPQKSRSTTPRINRHTTSQYGDICTSEGFMGDSENCRKFYRCINNQRGGFVRYEYLCSEPTIWDEDKHSCNHAWAVKRRRCGRGNPVSRNENTANNRQEDKINDVSPTAELNSAQSQLQINYGSRVTQTQTQISNGSVVQNQTQINYGDGNTNDATKPSALQNQTQISHGSAISQTQTQINYGDKAVQTQLQIDHFKESSQAQTQISDSTSTTRTTQHHEGTNTNTNNVCTESGFMGDAEDCKNFYRCVDNGRGGYIRYEFSCGEGTVWDSKIEACNHAWAVKGCGGKAPSESSTLSTTKITESSSKPTESASVSTISTTTQNYYSSTEEATEEDNDIPYGNQPGSSPTTKPPTVTNPSQASNDNNCRSSGFMGDNRDCKKFYRCVDNGNGGYTRYEFSCGDGTVWDQKIQACNHAWAVNNCGGDGGGGGGHGGSTAAASSTPTINTQQTVPQTTSQAPPLNEDYDTGYGPPQHDEQISSSTTVTTTTVKSSSQSPGSHTGNDCTSSGFMGDNNNCKKFYRCVDNGNGGYTRYEFSCGEGTVWDPKIQACNHPWAVEKCGGNSADDINKVETTTQKDSTLSTSSSTQILESGDDNDIGYGQQSKEPQTVTSTTSRPTHQENNNNECKSSGFIGDTNDCKKFYRCVDNGDGTFTRYEFVCGDGTVWDSQIDACNHPWAVKNPCSQSEINNIQSTSQVPSDNHETEPDDQGNNQPTTQKTSTSSNPISKPPGNQCTEEGFYGDENNCKNFYRCVDNGHGGFTKYEFTCGEGTVWRQDIQACDHDTPDRNCSTTSGSTSTKPNYEHDEMSPESTTKESVATTTNNNNNYNSQKPQSSNDQCESEGFYSDSHNCKKFYRCVDDGKGGYTKYDFTCGEGTVWDQEILACNHESSEKNCTANLGSASTTSSSSETTTNNEEQTTTRRPELTSSGAGSDHCKTEGFFANSNDCKKFYRCVSNGNGGYTKYDFSCGEGTVWVQEIQACDYDNDITSCSNKGSSSKPPTTQEQQATTTASSSTISQHTTQSHPADKEDDEYPSSSSSKPPAESEECTAEGFFGNKNDCTRFYRCVDNGQGGFTKYDFSCGEGTIWDQDITTCNHPQDVVNPSCNNNENAQPGSSSSSSPEDSDMSSSSSTTQTPQNATESNNQGSSNCSQESTTKKPANQKVKCDKAGFYPDPDDCKKFYRCVDWDGDGKRFSVYHFDCGEGTIWDPQLETCNHEDSVYPPRDCSGTQSQNVSQETTTTEQSTTTQDNTTTESTTTDSTTESSTTTEQSFSSESTTQSSTTEKTTSTQQSTSEQTTTEKTPTEQTTTEKTPTEQTTSSSTTTQTSTTGQSTTEQTTSTQEQTTQESTTSQQTTTQQSSTSEQTTQETTTSEKTTELSTTSEQTTQQTTTSEQTTTQQTTPSEQTTQQSSSSEHTTEQSSNTDATTNESMTTETSTTSTEQSSEQSTTEQMASENTTEKDNSTTESSTTTTTESSEGTTESESTEKPSSSEKECPETEDDQYVYVCPTSFRRHPKYCNMFYQCTEDENSHEMKIATFKCPNNTIYDESKTQCVKEEKADKKCNGEIAQKYRVKRRNANYNDPIEVSPNKHICNAAGYYPFEKDTECSGAFLKCQKTKYGKLRGYVHRCPNGYTYWSISKRCEKEQNMKHCKHSINNWRDRWEIPVEKKNIDK